MNNQSIDEARKVIIEALMNSNINQVDKLEFMINMHHFFQKKDYEKNVKALQKIKNRRIK